MSDNILADLTLKIATNTAELKEGLKDASTSVNRFQKDTKKAGSSVKESFGSIKEGISNMTAGLTDQLSEMTGGLSDFGAGIPGIVKGIKGMTGGMKLFKIALASTGIGLLVIALGALVAYLTQTKEGMEIVNKVMAGVGAVVSTIIKRFAVLGEAIALLFQGKVSEAADKAKESVKGIGEEIVNNFNTSTKLADQEAKLSRDKIKFLEREKQLLYEVEKAKTEFEKEDKYTEKQRLALIQEAMTKQKQLAKEGISLAQRELSIQEAKNKMAGGAEKLTNDELQKTYELRAKLFEIREDEQGKLAEMITMELEVNKAIGEQNRLHAEQLQLIKDKQALQDEIKALPKFEAKGSIELETDSDILPQVEMQMQKVTAAVSTTQVMAFQKLQETKQKITEATKEVATMIQETIGAAIASFGEMFGAIISGDAGGFKTFLNGILSLVLDFASKFGKLLISLGLAKVALESLGVSGVGAVIAGSALIALSAAMKGLLAKGIDAKANGGYSMGGLTMVGERGPELVSLPSGSHVTRANKTEQLLNNGNNITVKIISKLRGEDIYQSVQEITRKRGNTR